jgi:hypothetical protein
MEKPFLERLLERFLELTEIEISPGQLRQDIRDNKLESELRQLIEVLR